MRMLRRAALLAAFTTPLTAQVTSVRPVAPPDAGPTYRELELERAQFETSRRNLLPIRSYGRGSGPGGCDERIGRFCYWYDEQEPPPPPEGAQIAALRQRLIRQLDSAARARPDDKWVVAQRVRYHVEADSMRRAVQAAQECRAELWWCAALRGFANHNAGRYAAADSAFAGALALMPRGERCGFRDLTPVLDDEALAVYRRLDCDARVPFENRVWWLTRPMLSSEGNDARTEYYSRVLMTKLLDGAPSAHNFGFDADERELLLRYSWPRAWTRSLVSSALFGASQYSIVGHEPSPAYPYVPSHATLQSPSVSDSTQWRGRGSGHVQARYAPAYAARYLPLRHQAAVFRRGDSALVSVVYDVSSDSVLGRSDSLSAALVVTHGEEGDARRARLTTPRPRGTLQVTTQWGVILMSAEVAGRRTLARARYGLRPPMSQGSRVTISDLLLFEPYDDLPRSLDSALAHALTSLSIRRGSVGVYWEAYDTDPVGEEMALSITVAPADPEGKGWLTRRLQALRLIKEATPVSMGVRDVSTRGQSYTSRAVVVDLATLKPGRYLVQLEVNVAQQYVVRAEREIEVK